MLSYYPDGGPGVEFSRSFRVTAEGLLLKHAWTVEYSPLDYRVTAGQDLRDLPGYSGRAGVYVKVYPVRTWLLAGAYVAIALVVRELVAAAVAGATLAPGIPPLP